jgi:hypothetical protein
VPHSDLFDSLIGTYRDLNLKLRPLGEERLAAKNGDASLRDVISGMRTRELVASQQLKLMMLADVAGESVEKVDPASLVPVTKQTTMTLLSEFGTARESILAVVREMPDQELERDLPGVNGPESVAAFLQKLVTQDAEDQRKVAQLLG